jgi:hypothetical protein
MEAQILTGLLGSIVSGALIAFGSIVAAYIMAHATKEKANPPEQ